MNPKDRSTLLALWERSVRATHTFLNEPDIAFYRPYVAAFFEDSGVEIWVLTDAQRAPVGFIGLGEHSIEALFLDPGHRGRGAGRQLIAHAQSRRPGPLTVDVNEQNTAARGFYEALGFVATDRSPLDGTGRPYPIVHMRREPPEA